MDSHMCEEGFVVINNCSMNNDTNTGKDFNIVDEYGAVGDGETVNTAMIQAAIDDACKHYSELLLCGKRGHDARVVVPSPGKFVTGTLYLKTGVELYLEDGATRIGSTNRFDYHFGSRWMALLMAENESDFKVTGASHFSSIIDGQGQQLTVNIDNLIHEGKIIDPEYTNRPNEKQRPQIIEFINCRNITTSNIWMEPNIQTVHRVEFTRCGRQQ